MLVQPRELSRTADVDLLLPLSLPAKPSENDTEMVDLTAVVDVVEVVEFVGKADLCVERLGRQARRSGLAGSDGGGRAV
jgi:hypothetical protein